MNKRTTKKKASKPNRVTNVFGDFQTRDVPMFDGKSVKVTVLDGPAYFEYLQFVADNTDQVSRMGKLIALCVIDDKGEKIFKNGINPSALVKQIPGPAFVAVSQAAMALNGLTFEATEEAAKD